MMHGKYAIIDLFYKNIYSRNNIAHQIFNNNKINNYFLYQNYRLIIDIILCKNQRENLIIIDNE